MESAVGGMTKEPRGQGTPFATTGHEKKFRGPENEEEENSGRGRTGPAEPTDGMQLVDDAAGDEIGVVAGTWASELRGDEAAERAPAVRRRTRTSSGTSSFGARRRARATSADIFWLLARRIARATVCRRSIAGRHEQ